MFVQVRLIPSVVFSLSILFSLMMKTDGAAAEPQELLVDGELKGWVVDGRQTYQDKDGQARPVWTFADGILHCAGKGGGFLRYDKKLCDFEMHLEYRMTKGCNSGIGIRSVKFTGGRQTRPSFAGYELQILDDAGKNPHKHGSLSLYRYVAPTENAVKPAGEWNRLVITCIGSRIKVVLNEKTIHDIDQTNYPAIKDKPLCGYFMLQDHGKVIDFRKMKLREIETAEARNPN